MLQWQLQLLLMLLLLLLLLLFACNLFVKRQQFSRTHFNWEIVVWQFRNKNKIEAKKKKNVKINT